MGAKRPLIPPAAAGVTLVDVPCWCSSSSQGTGSSSQGWLLVCAAPLFTTIKGMAWRLADGRT
jgi:hypothetical protein